MTEQQIEELVNYVMLMKGKFQRTKMTGNVVRYAIIQAINETKDEDAHLCLMKVKQYDGTEVGNCVPLLEAFDIILASKVKP